MKYALCNSLGRSRQAFTPLRFSPALWLDASDANTLYDSTVGGSLVAADGAVARWEDKSGNGRHATQSTGVSQPLRKTGIQNGRDVVRFDGSNDYMDHPLAINGGNHTTFVVGKKSGGSTFGYFFQAANASTSVSAWIFSRYDSSTQWGSFQGGSYVLSGTEASSFTLMQSQYDGSNIKLRTNGANLVTGSGGLYGGDTGVRRVIGGNYSSSNVPVDFLTGDISEILVFPTAISDANRQAVEQYLAAKWGITLA